MAGRRGIDRHPVDLADTDAVRWLEACLWPDVPGRVERFRSAVSLLAGTRSPVVRGDMVDDLPPLLDDAGRAATADAHLVVFSSWALTYLDRGRRPEVADTLAVAAREGRPVTWLTAEPPHCTPGIEAPAERPEDVRPDHRPGHAVLASGVRAASARPRNRSPARRVGRPRLVAAGDLRAAGSRWSGPQQSAARLRRHPAGPCRSIPIPIPFAELGERGNVTAVDRLGGDGQPTHLGHGRQAVDHREHRIEVGSGQSVSPSRQVPQHVGRSRQQVDQLVAVGSHRLPPATRAPRRPPGTPSRRSSASASRW